MPSLAQVNKAEEHLLHSRAKLSGREQTDAVQQSSKMVFDTFKDSLKLFMGSIKYQDPMDPVDTSKMAEQMFQLAQAQGQYAMLEKIEEQNEVLRAGQVLNASNLIGKILEVRTNDIALDGKPVELGAFIPAGTSKARVEILDNKGKSVFEKELVPGKDEKLLPQGKQDIVWKGEVNTPYGKNINKGEALKEGGYKIRVFAYDEKGALMNDPVTNKPVEIPTSVKSPLLGSDFSDKKPKLKVGNQNLPLSAIVSIQEQPEAPKEEPEIDRGVMIRHALSALSEGEQAVFKARIKEQAAAARAIHEREQSLEQEINSLFPNEYNKLFEDIELKLNEQTKGDK